MSGARPHRSAAQQKLRELAIAILLLLGAAAIILVRLAPPEPLRPFLGMPAAAIPQPPDGRIYFGAQLDWPNDSPEAYRERVGNAALVFGEYVEFPFTSEIRGQILEHADAVRDVDGYYFLTLMPHGGLEAVDERALADLRDVMIEIGRRGVGVFLRFGHEMNGSWYPWGQQPQTYVDTYRRVVETLRPDAPDVVHVWGPNYGGQYPFDGGEHSAQPGTPAFEALDTNGDGRLSMDDDPYAPYYPGDDVVDWVALTIYHWGHAWPWAENEVPVEGKFREQLRGTYRGPVSDEGAVPDFYGEYAENRGKPFAIAETSAVYHPSRDTGASEHEIKTAWMSQVLDPDLVRRLPRLRMLLWFEHAKEETMGTGFVDWRAAADPAILDAFRQYLEPAAIVRPSSE